MVDPKREINYDADFSEYSYSWTCVIIFVMLLIITARKDINIFIKFNTLGVGFTIIIITFIIGVGIYGIS